MQDNNFRAIGASTYLAPIPVVLLGSGDAEHGVRPNLITVAWAGVACSKPPIISVGIRKERYSHGIISQTGEFTVNLVSEELCRAADFCGVKSGRDVDKFDAMGLTAIPANGLKHAPALAEAPAYLCCKVEDVIELGSHDLFLGKVEEVCVQDKYFTESGAIDELAMKLVGYVHGKYRALADEIGFFGYSIASPEALKRRGFNEEGKRV